MQLICDLYGISYAYFLIVCSVVVTCAISYGLVQCLGSATSIDRLQGACPICNITSGGKVRTAGLALARSNQYELN